MAKRTCELDGCGQKHEAKGLCRRHYMERWLAEQRTDCATCGETFTPTRHKQRVCSVSCRWSIDHSRDSSPLIIVDCKHCLEPFVQRGKGSPVYCSQGCREARPPAEETPCRECARPFTPSPYQRGQQAYCSKPCRTRVAKRTRRARKKLPPGDIPRVYRAQVYARDGYRCGICRHITDRTKRVPHPKAPTLDHIVPLAAGGPHTYENIQTACFSCNTTKSHTGPGQLRLSL